MTDFDSLLAVLGPVSHRFRSAGHELYLVGGIVRDRLLGLGLEADVDLTTDARPGVIKELLQPVADAIWNQGEEFGTIGAMVAGHEVEITTFRAESYASHSRKPDVVFGNDLRTDLSRRDFTINAMAVSVFDGGLHDPFGGRHDLEALLLRTPLDPELSFTDDPLRIMRAARFIPRFGLTPSAELAAAATRFSHRLSIVSAERVRQEFERLLAVDDPTAGLSFLVEHHVASRVVPELDRASWHLASGWAGSSQDVVVRRSAMMLGLGAAGARYRMTQLRYSKIDIAVTHSVIGLVPKVLDCGPAAADLRRLVFDAGRGAEPTLVDRAVALAAIIDTADRASSIAKRLGELRAQEDLSDFDLPVNGQEIMQILGVEPGPAIGRAVDRLRLHRIEHGPLDEETARAVLATFTVE